MSTENPICQTCGCEKVSIRGHYPGDHRRWTCTQCLVERLEDLLEQATSDPSDAGYATSVGGNAV